MEEALVKAWSDGIARGERLADESGKRAQHVRGVYFYHLQLRGKRCFAADYDLDIDARFVKGAVCEVAAILWSSMGIISWRREFRSYTDYPTSEELEQEALRTGLALAAETLPHGKRLRAWTDCRSLLSRMLDLERRRSVLPSGLKAIRLEWVPRKCLVEVDSLMRPGAVHAPKELAFGVAKRKSIQRGRALCAGSVGAAVFALEVP